MGCIRWPFLSAWCFLSAGCFADDGRLIASETAGSTSDETTAGTNDASTSDATSTTSDLTTQTSDLTGAETTDSATSKTTTADPTTSDPTTSDPTTSDPTTSDPTTSDPTTSDPTTSDPTTSDPTTSDPTEATATDSESNTLNTFTETDPQFECLYPLLDCNNNDDDMCEEDVSESNEHCGACDNPCNGDCFDGECIVRKYAFLTETVEKGNLGGLPGADEICQQQAELAELPGIYQAWLSTGSSNPESRFAFSPDGYMMPNGSLLATSWSDLTDGALANKLNITQFGDLIDYGPACNGTRVWSNTTIEGETQNQGSDCQQWMFDINLFSANVGNPGFDDEAWTVDDFCSPQDCNTFNHLYCFQQ